MTSILFFLNSSPFLGLNIYEFVKPLLVILISGDVFLIAKF